MNAKDLVQGLDVVVHLGMHKTGSSFLQRRFFDVYSEEAVYYDLRAGLLDFRNYVLFTNDLNFCEGRALELFWAMVDMQSLRSGRVTFSEEMLCGNPYLNAATRQCVVDRLIRIFPRVRFIVVFRVQESMVQSLYLQYVKMGGACTWKEFLGDRNEVLSFSLGAYLNYGFYLDYLRKSVGGERVKCLLYEDLKSDALMFVKDIAQFIGFEIDERFDSIKGDRVNKSLSVRACSCLRFINKFAKSHRQPYQLLPVEVQQYAKKMLVAVSSGKSSPIPDVAVSEFCADYKKANVTIADFMGREIESLGY